MFRWLKNFGRGKDSSLPEVIKRHLKVRQRLNLKSPVEETEFVVFDTELTGTDFKEDRIISIGAVRMRGDRIFPGHTFFTLVKPEAPLKATSVVIHGITPEDLKNAPTTEEALLRFLEFIDEAVLVAHFAFVDRRFIDRALKDLFGITLQSPLIDTIAIHEWLYENDTHFKKHFHGMTTRADLYSLAQRYGIPVQQLHDALEDAFITAQLFQRFLRFLPLSGIRRLDELLMIGKS